MIRKAAQLPLSYEDKLKNGTGTVRLRHILEEERGYGAGRLFAVSIIPPGGCIGRHRHEGDFEIYYIMKGKALVVDNGTEDTLGPGDSMVCFDGDEHSIANAGDCDLEYIAFILYSKNRTEERQNEQYA
ncbi:MAG: cupin domain-containing protein [Gracilibacteraceae bacterium]|jgi:mannose-6-phosphate isomerase-like protein (cupin superfamily)|nr:cupin domain-containing protein [Gracilibacteraceae bacterium]